MSCILSTLIFQLMMKFSLTRATPRLSDDGVAGDLRGFDDVARFCLRFSNDDAQMLIQRPEMALGWYPLEDPKYWQLGYKKTSTSMIGAECATNDVWNDGSGHRYNSHQAHTRILPIPFLLSTKHACNNCVHLPTQLCAHRICLFGQLCVSRIHPNSVHSLLCQSNHLGMNCLWVGSGRPPTMQ